MKYIQILVLHLLMVITITLSAPQELLPEEPSNSLMVNKLQPPPLTISSREMASTTNLRKKRCGGGGGCYQPAPAKTYHISISVKKAPAPKMVYKPVAVVPVAIVPVKTYTYAQPATYCCGGGGGGGYGKGGGGHWKKG